MQVMIPIPDEMSDRKYQSQLHYTWLMIDFVRCRFRIFDSWREPTDEDLLTLVKKVTGALKNIWTSEKTDRRAYRDLLDFRFEIAYIPKQTIP